MHNNRNISYSSRKGIFFSLLLLILFIGLLGKTALLSGQSQTDTAALSEDQKVVLYSLEDAFSAIASRAQPGVVSITAVQKTGIDGSLRGDSSLTEPFLDEYNDPASNGFFPGIIPDDSTVTASGSGAIVRRQGNKFFVITNYHVVENAYKVNVALFDETVIKGIVIGLDPVSDLAVVQIESPKLDDRNILQLGDSNKVKVGSWALAVGTPYGFDHSLTVGVVSALHRELEGETDVYPDLIQTDAAINKGNSGGPLLDIEGNVVGINTAIASPTGGFIGLGFAIPINNAKVILDALIKEGRVIRGWLGVGIQELTPVLQDFYKTDHGVLVASVDDNSPAGRSGIKGEDIIVKVGDIRIDDLRQLQKVISDISPGTRTSISIIRNNKPGQVNVSIGLMPSTPVGRPVPPVMQNGMSIKVVTLTKDLADRVGITADSGVVVLDVKAGSSAEEAGLESGDVILSCNNKPVRSEDQFNKMLDRASNDDAIVLKIMRDNMPRIIGFRKD